MSQRIKAYFRSLLCRAASWFKYRRPVLVRRYVVIERDTLEEECRNVHNWLAGACKDAATLGQKLNDKIDECDSWREAAGERQEKIEQLKGDINYLLKIQDELQQDLRSERQATAAQIKSLEGQLNAAIIEAAELQKVRDEEVRRHNETYHNFGVIQLAYSKARRAIEDVKQAVGAS